MNLEKKYAKRCNAYENVIMNYLMAKNVPNSCGCHGGAPRTGRGQRGRNKQRQKVTSLILNNNKKKLNTIRLMVEKVR